MKKNLSPKAKRIALFISFLIALAVVGDCIYTAMPAEIEVTAEQLIIKGRYDLTIAREDITEMEIRDQLPPSIARTNGLSFRHYRKGHFQLRELGNVRLYLHVDTGPYLIVYSKGNKPVIIDRGSPEEFYELCESLKLIRGKDAPLFRVEQGGERERARR